MRNAGFVILFFLLTGIVNDCLGQEVLLDLQSLPIKDSGAKKSKLKVNSKSTLPLPFFDDFSMGISYPNQTIWANKNVIVNQTYAINPPTIGVATFDAINSKGELYENLSLVSLTADTLTSKPIDLNYPESDSLYLSFQYQAKGLGKEPQVNDSLVVEFYSLAESKWLRIWSASANFSSNSITEKHKLRNRIVKQANPKLSEKFFNVLLPITDERFRKDGFMFRFMNYASLPQNQQVPSLRGNGDHWHIDMVYLDKYRNYVDTLLNDVAFRTPIKSFLKNYESIPWKHFTAEAIQSELSNPLEFRVIYSNLGPTTWNVTRRYEITNLSNPLNPYIFSGGAENIYTLETTSYTRDYEYTFSSNWEDSAKFAMKSYLITEFDPNTQYLRYNDTIRYTQQFFNYYAYDDGSAENGYGIYGEGTQNGMVALRYHSYIEDSLKGILMYFNRTYKDTSKQFFNLTIWKDANGKPGDTLYQKRRIKPIFTDSLNMFALYGVDRALKVGGDFWVGWVNTTTHTLNVGFDLNNNHSDKLYYNISGEWVKTQFNGSLMIRPVFNKLTQNPTSVVKPSNKVEFQIYPNPASNQVNLAISEDLKPETIRIISLAGQVLINKAFDNSSIDISNIPTGIYLLQVMLPNRITTSKKLVIIK